MLQQDVQMAGDGGEDLLMDQDQAEEERSLLPFGLDMFALGHVLKHLDFNSVLRCRLVNSVWASEAHNAIYSGAVKSPWVIWEPERKALDHDEINLMFHNLSFPSLFTSAYVTTGSRLAKHIPLFQNHGIMITKLKINTNYMPYGADKYKEMSKMLWNMMFVYLPNVEEAEFFYSSSSIWRRPFRGQMNALGRQLLLVQMNNTARPLLRLRKLTFGGFFVCLFPDITRYLPAHAPNLEHLQFNFWRFRAPDHRPSKVNSVILYAYQTVLAALRTDPRAGNPRVKFTVQDDQNRFEIMNPEFNLQDMGSPNVPAPYLMYTDERVFAHYAFTYERDRNININEVLRDLPRI